MASKAIEIPIQPFSLLSIRIADNYSVWKKGTARIQLRLLSIAQLGTAVHWIAQWMIQLGFFFCTAMMENKQGLDMGLHVYCCMLTLSPHYSELNFHICI